MSDWLIVILGDCFAYSLMLFLLIGWVLHAFWWIWIPILILIVLIVVFRRPQEKEDISEDRWG